MAKVRVYELAKEFGVESKDVMDQLKEMGEFVRSASSTIEAPIVRRLKEAYAAKAAEQNQQVAGLASSAQPPRAAGSSAPRPGAPRPGPRPGNNPFSSTSAVLRSEPPTAAQLAARSVRADPGHVRNRVDDGRQRKVLSLSVSSFGSSTNNELDVYAPRPLPFATERALTLGKALASLGYSSWQPATRNGSAETLGLEVDGAISAVGHDEVLVVHIVSHGHLAETGAVYIVGSDGRTHALTDVEHWLKAVENFPDRSYTLFLLDLCHSGVAARLPWQVALADGSSRAWVIAACEPDQQAFDGRFSQAAANVLDKLYCGQLDIDRSMRYIPLATIAREIRREVDVLASAAGSLRQQVTCSIVDISANVELPFFPNPDYVDDERYRVRGRIDTALAPFLDDLDEAFDAGHFVSRATGHGPMADRIGSGCFSGREDELIALTGWMNRDEDGAIRLVTGSAGVGKSALIGVLVCAAHPVLRIPTKLLWDRVARVPARIPHMAAVHARQRGIAEVTESLAKQLGFDGCVSPEVLVKKIRQSPTLPMLVVDALDEALEPLTLVDRLLFPLVTARNENGAPVCRLLVGVRSDPEFGGLRAAAVAENGLIDLDDVSDDRLRRDLEEYIDKLLKSQTPYDRRKHAAARANFAAAAAEALVSRRAGRRWGEFLVAALYTHHLLTTYEPIEDSGAAETLGLQVPSELREVLELDLRYRRNVPFLRPVLAALAHTLGGGMPASLIRAIVPLFAANLHPSADEVAQALDATRFYLRHTADADGTTIYRLFHQGLSDYLRQHPVDPETSAVSVTIAQGIVSHLLNTLSTPDENLDTQPRRWAFAEPYLLRHALQHAVVAGRPALVASDPEFLVHADPSVVGPFFSDTSAQELLPTAEVYRSALGELRSPNLNDRRQALAFAAASSGMTTLARQLANPPGQPPLTWQPVWAVTKRPTANDGNKTGGSDAVTTAIIADLLSGPAVIVLTEDGAIASWDLETGRNLNSWPKFYSGCRLKELRIGGQSAILASSGGQHWICLDPTAGADFTDIRGLHFISDQGLMFLESTGFAAHVSRRTSIDLEVFSIVDGQIVIVNRKSSNALAVRNFQTGELIGELTHERSGSPTTLASWVLRSRPVLLSGTDDGTLCLWDLASCKLHDILTLHQPVEVMIPAPHDRLVVVAGGDLFVLQRTTESGASRS